MSRFLEPEPWLKARIDPTALSQKPVPANNTALTLANYSHDQIKAFAEKRMREVDAMTPEWRAFVHEHGLKKARKAIKEFGVRSIKRAEVLGGLNLSALDL